MQRKRKLGFRRPSPDSYEKSLRGDIVASALSHELFNRRHFNRCKVGCRFGQHEFRAPRYCTASQVAIHPMRLCRRSYCELPRASRETAYGPSSCAIEKRTRSRGCWGLNSMVAPSVVARSRASAIFALAVILTPSSSDDFDWIKWGAFPSPFAGLQDKIARCFLNRENRISPPCEGQSGFVRPSDADGGYHCQLLNQASSHHQSECRASVGHGRDC